jgi:hypothetical protein
MPALSRRLAAHPDMQNSAALARVRVAMKRLPNVLETQVVANQKTLEMKISEQGPRTQRVDPHLLGLAIRQLTEERRIVNRYDHPAVKTSWLANARTEEKVVREHLDVIAPIYAAVSAGTFKNRIGDALEIVTQRAIEQLRGGDARYSFSGYFDLSAPLNKEGRIPKIEPPHAISGNHAEKLADFHLHGFVSGPVCVECKNYREWVYPSSTIVAELIEKALGLDATPLLVARSVHYTTVAHLLAPAGILVHETYHQYYPEDEIVIATKVADKRLLGFTDVRATYSPAPRTRIFFSKELPSIVDEAAKRFRRNRNALSQFVDRKISLADLYRAISSPAVTMALGPYDVPF